MTTLDTDTLEMVLSTIRDYATKELTPAYLRELDERDEFPHKVLQDLYDSDKIGVHLIFIPEEFDGLGGGAYDVYRVSELMAKIDLGIATGVLATFLGTDPIVVGGTDEQKAHWMGRIAREGLLVAYGATEPQAGSDLGSLTTKAVPVEEDGKIVGYKISGRKQWISNGGVAKLYTILANAPGGPTWFAMEAGQPGFSFGKPEDKHGIRASNTAALFLDEVFIPVENLIGGVEGQGLAQAQAVFGYTRLMVAAFGLGGGWGALERAIRYSQTRVQGGALLSTKQAYTHKLLVPNAVRLEASRSYIEWVAERIDGGDPNQQTEGAVVKYFATESGNKAAEDAIQAHGGYGYTKEYMVEKVKRDVRITCIYEGTSEIMEWTIARDRWQLHLKTKGAFYNDWAVKLEQLARTTPDTGAAAAALAMRALALILERARLDRLTRNQHVLFRLGEIIAWAETAAIYSERSATKPSVATPFDPTTQRLFARIHAREAAFKVATEGLHWTLAAGQTDPNFAASLGLSAIYSAMGGQIEDMNLAAEKLVAAYPAE